MAILPSIPALAAIPALPRELSGAAAPVVSTTAGTTTLPIALSPPASPALVAATPRPAKPVLRRDSLSRREAFLRGNEGTRRRRRWENDRLLSNPHVVPPTEADWEPRPLYPRRNVPYEFASLYDHPLFVKQRETVPKSEPAEKMPRALKSRLKKSRGAVGLLRSLEEEVRKFVLGEADEKTPQKEEDKDEVIQESDEEIVFISKRAQRFELKTEKVLLESPIGDPAASFSRWLVHSIASYYGLKSWSITTGNPAKRVAYVGLTKDSKKPSTSLVKGMPKPLWLML